MKRFPPARPSHLSAWIAFAIVTALLLFMGWNTTNSLAQQRYDDRAYDDRRDNGNYDDGRAGERARDRDRQDNRRYRNDSAYDRRDDNRRNDSRRYDSRRDNYGRDGDRRNDARRDQYDSNQPDGSYDTGNSYCRQLERQLASDWVSGHANTNAVPELNIKIRAKDKRFNKLQNKADRMDCYESMFIFGRSVRRTRRCLSIDKKIRKVKRELKSLRKERASIRDSRNDGARRKRLINELSRNNCGEQYTYEARRNRSNSWLGGGLGELFGGQYQPRPRRRDNISTKIQPYATYRTMCVRLCDGFYFPVSFSTLPSNFPKDAGNCQNECAAPAELYVYRNPGGEIEQMISPDGRPYEELKNAWRFKKQYIKGCSCKPTEFSEETIALQEEELKNRKRGSKAGGKQGKQGKKNQKSKQGALKPHKKSAAASRKTAKDKPPSSIEDLIR